MFACKRTSQKGFSLVELMVVVAIIGVLASIAVPQVNKFIAKARQSEAKTNLSSYYTAQKAFMAEYNVYDRRFGAIGFTPEGAMRYNIGSTATGFFANATDHGFRTTIAGAGSLSMASTYCPAAPANTCRVLKGVNDTAPANVATVVNAADFTAQARAFVYSSSGAGTEDIWTIDNFKNLINTQNGVP